MDEQEPAPVQQQPLLDSDIREANQRLVIAAMVAHELQAKSDEAYREQLRFLAVIAHELRNPLAPIRSAAELMSGARADDRLLERLQALITRQVGHMAKLVDDLLEGARVNAGKFGLDRKVVDLVGILSQAGETCAGSFRMRRQHLIMQLPPQLVELNADPIRLTQIFTNLLDNASKYTQEEGTIRVTVELRDNAVATTVSDNGSGIAAAVLPHVFDLFVQGAAEPGGHPGGLGVGLAVVRELAQAHGGTVVGTSAGKGLGSQFTVTLPLAAPEPGPDDA